MKKLSFIAALLATTITFSAHAEEPLTTQTPQCSKAIIIGNKIIHLPYIITVYMEENINYATNTYFYRLYVKTRNNNFLLSQHDSKEIAQQNFNKVFEALNCQN